MVCWKKAKTPKERERLKKLHERMGHKHDDEDLSEQVAVAVN
jgi:hypothetical protein